MALYSLGRREFADQFEDEDPATRSLMIDLHTHLVYEKQLRNLQLQEARLHRRREKDWAELRQLQKERKDRELAALAAEVALPRKPQRQDKTQETFGFEFSSEQIDDYRTSVTALQLVQMNQNNQAQAA